jgi:hypothetical protein
VIRTRGAATLEEFRDLVFSPLDLPPPPAVDSARLVAWMAWAHGEAEKSGRNVPERNYEAQTGRQYPWLMTALHYSAPGSLEAAFGCEFPQVVQYARFFPLRGLKLIALIAQREGTEVHLHTDSDGYWGLRFYLANRSSDALYFCMARDAAAELPRRADDWSALLDSRRKHYARWPAGNPPYCLNSIRAAHAVDANTCSLGQRIACLVVPQKGHDERALLDLLRRSTARFGAYQLWYRPTRRVEALTASARRSNSSR